MTDPSGRVNREDSVLIFAPVGRDAELTRDLLDRAAIPCAVCQSIAEMIAMFDADDAAALLLTEEALDDPEFSALIRRLEEQPPWSDVPVLLFVGAAGADMSVRAVRAIQRLLNVTLLERPVRLAAVLTTVRASVRSRKRQFEVRDLLVALHRARAEAESANRLKDEFLATLSHELRTPLNAILGWTSMLARGQIESSRLPRVFEVLDRNAQSQAQLIADVLDVSRIITGKLQLHPAVIDLSETVARAIDAVRPASAAKNLRLTFQAAPGLVVRGDPERLQQVFWNLLSNAVKFTPSEGSVHVNVSRQGDAVTVTVVDSGVGFAQEFAPFLFDRFRQADQTTTRSYGGLGLGLSIVKHLTELHGGTVAASSGGPGRGARFAVQLPAAEGDIQPRSAGLTPSTTLHLEGHTILIVDDDGATREVVAAALEAAHARVCVAASAADARRRLQEDAPSLIIADIGMPGEDGLSLIRDWRRQKLPTPAIALSAYADDASRTAALSAGFTAFLAKPTRADALVQLVDTLLHDGEAAAVHTAANTSRS